MFTGCTGWRSIGSRGITGIPRMNVATGLPWLRGRVRWRRAGRFPPMMALNLTPQLKAVSLILIKFVNEYAHGGPGLAVAAYLIIGKHGKE